MLLTLALVDLKQVYYTLLKKKTKQNPQFIIENLNDICASIQHSIVNILIKKIEKAAKETNICNVAIAGGVSANSELRKQLKLKEDSHNWKTYIPDFSYCTDNAAMVAITGYYKYLSNQFCDQKISAKARLSI